MELLKKKHGVGRLIVTLVAVYAMVWGYRLRFCRESQVNTGMLGK